MSEILIDVSRLVGRRLKRRLPTGIDRVGLAYLRHYRDRARAVFTLGTRAIVLSRSQSDRLARSLLAGWSLPGKEEPSLIRTVIGGAVTASLRNPIGRDDTAGRWFLNTGHSGLHRHGYAEMLAALKVKPLFLIHDLIPITHPQYCRALEATRHADRMKRALGLASAMVCNSHATFEQLSEFARLIDVPLPPAAVAPIAADPPGAQAIATASAGPPIEDPYFLMIGTIEPRKNHLLMLQVWQRLIHRLGGQTPKLVLIGQEGWECEHVMRTLARAPGLSEHVLHLQRCDDSALHGWIAHARALLFPTFAEGFGLPVVEALQRGVPVIATDLQVFREFAGDYPEYLDPLDAAGWLAAIDEYRKPGNRRRERRVAALTAYRDPTWSEHFARVDDLMRRVDRRVGFRQESEVQARTGAAAAATELADG